MEIAIQGGMPEVLFSEDVVFSLFSQRSAYSWSGGRHWVFSPRQEETCFLGVPGAKEHVKEENNNSSLG